MDKLTHQEEDIMIYFWKKGASFVGEFRKESHLFRLAIIANRQFYTEYRFVKMHDTNKVFRRNLNKLN